MQVDQCGYAKQVVGRSGTNVVVFGRIAAVIPLIVV